MQARLSSRPDGAGLLRGQQLRQRQPGRAKRADLQKLPGVSGDCPLQMEALFFSQKSNIT